MKHSFKVSYLTVIVCKYIKLETFRIYSKIAKMCKINIFFQNKGIIR